MTSSAESETTLNSRLSSAELCRRNGWTPGTVLAADRLPKEEPGPEVRIVLTAVGEKMVLAAHWDPLGDEHPRDLTTRDWRFVIRLGRPGDEP